MIKTYSDDSDESPKVGEVFVFSGLRLMALSERSEEDQCEGCVFDKEEARNMCLRAPKCHSGGDDDRGIIFVQTAKVIHVCTTCGSPRVFADAFSSLNTDEVRTFDDTHCDDCGGECKTQEVEIPAEFDLETDFYKEEA